jgi:predicted O-methyltransferase YrrM
MMETFDRQREAFRILQFAQNKHMLAQFYEAEHFYREAIAKDPSLQEAYNGLVRLLLSFQRLDEARNMLSNWSLLPAPLGAHYYYLKFLLDHDAQDLKKSFEVDADYIEGHSHWSILAMPEEHYYKTIACFFEKLKPQAYLEIGVDAGHCIVAAHQCPVVIGVDPDPKIRHALPEHFQIFKKFSHDFFAEDGDKITSPFDLIFIDGSHESQDVYDDFLHVLPHLHDDSIVLLHDILPLNDITAQKKRQTLFWTGDVWKAVWAIVDRFPELSIEALPAAPSGLGVVRGFKRLTQLDGRNGSIADYDNRTIEDYQAMLRERGIAHSNLAGYVEGLPVFS